MRVASVAPIAEPTTTPAMITVKLTTSFITSVAMIATAMPTAAI
jgi:hypothetical protein